MNREDADANGAARQWAGPAPPRVKRKKGRLPATPPVTQDPVPEPYLALAPAPITAAVAKPESGLILPSDYVRSVNPSELRYASGLISPPSVMPGGSTADRSNNGGTPRPLPTPTPSSRGYITSLLSPPFVVPGGRTPSPLPLPPRPPLPHTGSSRSVQRNRETPPVAGRRSPVPPLSIPPHTTPADMPSTPRRRAQRSRVVNSTISRRPTVSSREEHLSRRASMRRTNVWDDLDLGDAPEPPPPFPFPTTSNARLPPTFSPVDLSPQTRGMASVMSDSPHDRPDSPPPPFEQAILQQRPPPLPRPPTPPSPSETATVEGEEDDSMFETDEQREDRRMWNADILSGYSLEERVAREAQRRAARPEANVHGSSSTVGEPSGVPRSEVEAAVREANGSRLTSKASMEIAVRTAIEVLRGRQATKAEILAVARDALAHKGRPIKRGTAEAVLPTTPATFVERNAGRANVLTRQEEPGVFYRLVHGQNESRARASQARSSASPDPEPPHNSSGDLLGINNVAGRSRSLTVTPTTNHSISHQTSPLMSTVDDIASIYNLPRPAPRQNTQAEASNQGNSHPYPTSPGQRVLSNGSIASQPSNTSSILRRQDSPSLHESPKQNRSDSPFRTVTPGLYRTESHMRSGSPALFARSGSPLNYVTSPGNCAGSPQTSMNTLQSQQQQRSDDDYMQTKKELLAALERESSRRIPEPPRPVMINTRQDTDTPVVSRSEEPGVLYRLVTNRDASSRSSGTHSTGWPGQVGDRTSQDSQGLQQSPSLPQFGQKLHGHTRASSTSQAQSAVIGPSSQLRQHRAPKSVATDPTPLSPNRERGASISGPPLWVPSMPGVVHDGRASPAPMVAPPLPPRPPLEYISEYKPRSSSGPTPGHSSAASHRHMSAGSVSSQQSESTPHPPSSADSTRPWSIESPNTNTWSSKPPLPTPSTPLRTPPITFSSPPATRRPALPSIPSSSSARTMPQTPVTPGRATHRSHTSLQLEPVSGVIGLGIGIQASVGSGSMPVTSPAERNQMTSPTNPTRTTSDSNLRPTPSVGSGPSVGYGSLPLPAPPTAGDTYSSLTSAPGSRVYPSGPHTGLSPMPLSAVGQSEAISPQLPSAESASTRWLKRLGSVDKSSMRSPSTSTGSLTAGVTNERQGSVSRSEDSGRGTPLLGERMSESPSHFHRRPSADPEAQRSPRPESPSARLSTTIRRDSNPQVSEPGSGSNVAQRSSGSLPETKEESNVEGSSTLSESSKPVDIEPKRLSTPRRQASDPINDWASFQYENALILLSTSPRNSRPSLPPGAQPSAFSPPLPSPKKTTSTPTDSVRQFPEPPTRDSVGSLKLPNRTSVDSREHSQASTTKSEESTSASAVRLSVENPEAEPPTAPSAALETPERDSDVTPTAITTPANQKDEKVVGNEPAATFKAYEEPPEELHDAEDHSDEDPFGEDYLDEDDSREGVHVQEEHHEEGRLEERKANGISSPIKQTAPPQLPMLFSQRYDPIPTSPNKLPAEEDAPTTELRSPMEEEPTQHLEQIRLDEHGNIIPPGREAALKRRSLYTPPPNGETRDQPMDLTDVPVMSPQRAMSMTKKGKRPAPPPPNLLGVPSANARLSLSTHLNPPSPSAVSPDIVSLAASTSALLNLLEAADTRPMAESSAQGAAKAAAREQFRFELAQQREIEAQIHESLERVQNRTKYLPPPPPRDEVDLSEEDDLPGYERGSEHHDIAEKRISHVDEPQWVVAPVVEPVDDEDEDEEPGPEVIDFSSPRDAGSVSEQVAATEIKGHARTQSQQYVVPPPSRARVLHGRSQSHTTAPSMPFVPSSPLSPSSASTSDLLSTASMDLRRRAPGPPPTRPPPPPPPSKQGSTRPPPPPPPSRPPPSVRAGPPIPERFNNLKAADKVKGHEKEVSSTKHYLDPMHALAPSRSISPNTVNDSHESLAEIGYREMSPLSAPSTVWKQPRFVSPLDPYPPARAGDLSSPDVPPVPPVPKSIALTVNSASPHHRAVYLMGRGKGGPGPSDRPQNPPRSAAPNLLSPDSPATPVNGPLSAPAIGHRRVPPPPPTNPSMWHYPAVFPAPPATSSPPVPRRPPPPIPVRNSAEFLASGTTPMANVPSRPRKRDVLSYSSSTSSLLDLEAMATVEPTESAQISRRGSAESGTGPQPVRRGSRGQVLTNLTQRWTRGNAQTPTTAPVTPATPTANGSRARQRSPETSALHGWEHHTTSSDHHSSEHTTASSEEATTPRGPSSSVPTTHSPEITDLDVFASNLEGTSHEYEGLTHLAEFIGPAREAGASDRALGTLLPAPVEVESRRINAKGKVKLKLSVLGTRVANCPICLAQFRGGDAAVLLPRCSHVSHETCAWQWFRRSDICMVCRTPLKMPT